MKRTAFAFAVCILLYSIADAAFTFAWNSSVTPETSQWVVAQLFWVLAALPFFLGVLAGTWIAPKRFPLVAAVFWLASTVLSLSIGHDIQNAAIPMNGFLYLHQNLEGIFCSAALTAIGVVCGRILSKRFNGSGQKPNNSFKPNPLRYS